LAYTFVAEIVGQSLIHSHLCSGLQNTHLSAP